MSLSISNAIAKVEKSLWRELFAELPLWHQTLMLVAIVFLGFGLALSFGGVLVEGENQGAAMILHNAR